MPPQQYSQDYHAVQIFMCFCLYISFFGIWDLFLVNTDSLGAEVGSGHLKVGQGLISVESR